ncbi:protein of unknown function [Tenacibaculum sp. 190524A02b]|uniref:biotin/lipoyl-containing protein n=1 Tax=Tenacibaculum vairaonense TaxID=3137860 RepID=UPI0032B1A875
MINQLKILLGKDGFRKNKLLTKLKLFGLVNEKIKQLEILNKDEEIDIRLPEEFEGSIIKKWNFKPGSIVDYNDILCVTENNQMIFELESFYLGKITYINKTKLPLKGGELLLKIKGL